MACDYSHHGDVSPCSTITFASLVTCPLPCLHPLQPQYYRQTTMWLAMKSCGKKSYWHATPSTMILLGWGALHVASLYVLYIIQDDLRKAEYSNFVESTLSDYWLTGLVIVTVLLYLSLFNSDPGYLKQPPAPAQPSSASISSSDFKPLPGRTHSYVNNLGGLTGQGQPGAGFKTRVDPACCAEH